jgi:hypothetical protein
MRTRLIALFFAISVMNAATGEDSITSHMPRDYVESSALRSIGYSKRRHILEIEFASGATYRYFDVAPSVYRDLMAADSKTRYYDLNIRRKYRSARVKPRKQN